MSDHDVGYRKPPKAFQFKAGVSGNPKGRPKRKAVAVGDIINNVLDASTEYRDRGQTRKGTRRELTIRKYVRLALSGNVKAAETLLKLREHAKKYGNSGSRTIRVGNFLPDHPGQTAEQKTREFDRANEADAPEWWKPAGDEPPDDRSDR